MTEIYALFDYNWEKVSLVKENQKTYKISWNIFDGQTSKYRTITKNIPKEKCAFPDEQVCIVWEQWKGVNGRGGYRVEKNLYSGFHVSANCVARQHGSGRVSEEVFGMGAKPS